MSRPASTHVPVASLTDESSMLAEPTPKRLSIVLWIAQILLALPFAAIGWMKTTTALGDFPPEMTLVSAETLPLIRFIGVAELAGAAGLILPAATRIAPKLTPLAAFGLLVIMILAAGYHLSKGEIGSLPVNFVFGALAAFIAWGRAKKAPIVPR